MSETRTKPIAWYNPTTKKVTPYGDLMSYGTNGRSIMEAVASDIKDANDEGLVRHIENINGKAREVQVNIKGRTKLDRQRRGGQPLWIPLFTKDELREAFINMGVTVDAEEKVKKEVKEEVEEVQVKKVAKKKATRKKRTAKKKVAKKKVQTEEPVSVSSENETVQDAFAAALA